MLLTLALSLPLLSPSQDGETDKLFVVTSLPYIAEVVRQVGGEEVEAVSLVAPGVDPHHVELSPAQLAQLRRADLFLENGMQLESWAPRVLEASGRADLAQGERGHGFVTNGIAPLEVPAGAQAQAGGHSHSAGNPHVWLDPLNLKIIANNVAADLSRLAPEHRSDFQKRSVAYAKLIDAAFFGKDLEALIGGRTLDRLHRSGRLVEFLESKEVRGEKLIGKLGGWLGRARALGDKKVFTYHRTWSYLEQALGLEVVATLEEKPGIPPGPVYLEKLSGLARSKAVRIVLAPPFYPSVRIQGFAERIGGTALILPSQPGEAEQTEDLFAMFDQILSALEVAGLER